MKLRSRWQETLDPERKAVEIYRPGDSPEVLHEPSSVQGCGPVAGLSWRWRGCGDRGLIRIDRLTVARKPGPYREMEALPTEDCQLLREADGWIRVKPIAGCRVSLVEVAIGAELSRWTDEDGRGKAFLCAGFILPDTSMLGCHLAWMLNERWQSLSREEQRGFAPRCPDFVIEILSPFDKPTDLEAKMELWIANGAQLAWLIDLDREAVQVHRPGEAVEVLEHPSLVCGPGPVGGLS
jgi:Uma2 family endonuclease